MQVGRLGRMILARYEVTVRRVPLSRAPAHAHDRAAKRVRQETLVR